MYRLTIGSYKQAHAFNCTISHTCAERREKTWRRAAESAEAVNSATDQRKTRIQSLRVTAGVGVTTYCRATY
jgi:hypothetical protein